MVEQEGEAPDLSTGEHILPTPEGPESPRTFSEIKTTPEEEMSNIEAAEVRAVMDQIVASIYESLSNQNVVPEDKVRDVKTRIEEWVTQQMRIQPEGNQVVLDKSRLDILIKHIQFSDLHQN